MKRRDAHNQLRDASKYESGERRLDVIEFLEVCKALKVNPTTIVQQLEINDG